MDPRELAGLVNDASARALAGLVGTKHLAMTPRQIKKRARRDFVYKYDIEVLQHANQMPFVLPPIDLEHAPKTFDRFALAAAVGRLADVRNALAAQDSQIFASFVVRGRDAIHAHVRELERRRERLDAAATNAEEAAKLARKAKALQTHFESGVRWSVGLTPAWVGAVVAAHFDHPLLMSLCLLPSAIPMEGLINGGLDRLAYRKDIHFYRLALNSEMSRAGTYDYDLLTPKFERVLVADGAFQPGTFGYQADPLVSDGPTTEAILKADRTNEDVARPGQSLDIDRFGADNLPMFWLVDRVLTFDTVARDWALVTIVRLPERRLRLTPRAGGGNARRPTVEAPVDPAVDGAALPAR